MYSKIVKAVTAGLATLLACQAHADGAATAAEQCSACHALEAPDFETLGIAERASRMAPPLYYAGNKYRAQWLEEWLQSPVTIYPAGYFPNASIVNTPEGDVPDTENLHGHLALDAATAGEVTEYLMSLTPKDELIEAVDYTPGNLALRMGTMDFRRFKGCNACHQDAPGEGGFSGPVLHDAWQRLQAEYIVSFVSDPVAWDPNTIMPRMEMNEAAVMKLADYLRLVGEAQ